MDSMIGKPNIQIDPSPILKGKDFSQAKESLPPTTVKCTCGLEFTGKNKKEAGRIRRLHKHQSDIHKWNRRTNGASLS